MSFTKLVIRLELELELKSVFGQGAGTGFGVQPVDRVGVEWGLSDVELKQYHPQGPGSAQPQSTHKQVGPSELCCCCIQHYKKMVP